MTFTFGINLIVHFGPNGIGAYYSNEEWPFSAKGDSRVTEEAHYVQ